MALPVVLHQDPAEVRVALDPDAHHVPGLTLVPVRGRPDGHDARDRLVLVEPDPDAYAARTRDRDQLVIHREALPLWLGALFVVLLFLPGLGAVPPPSDVACGSRLAPTRV